MKCNHLLMMLFFLGLGLQIQAQKTINKASFPLKVAILDESISLPDLSFTRYAFNPAIMLGTEYVLQKKNKHEWLLTANLGCYYHKEWQTAVFLNSEIGYRQSLGRLKAELRLGVGYLHSFYPGTIHQLNDGVFEKITDWGNPTLMPSLALSLAYPLQQEDYSPEVFLSVMETVELPLTIYTGVHFFVGVGIKFYPFK